MANSILVNHYQNLLTTAELPAIKKYTLDFTNPAVTVKAGQGSFYSTGTPNVKITRKIHSIITEIDSADSAWTAREFSINADYNPTFRELVAPIEYEYHYRSGSSYAEYEYLVVTESGISIKYESIKYEGYSNGTIAAKTVHNKVVYVIFDD